MQQVMFPGALKEGCSGEVTAQPVNSHVDGGNVLWKVRPCHRRRYHCLNWCNGRMPGKVAERAPGLNSFTGLPQST